MLLWHGKAYVAKETYKLPGVLLGRQVTNVLWWRCLRVPWTPEPDGETEVVLGGWELRVATDSLWQHMQAKEASECRRCMENK